MTVDGAHNGCGLFRYFEQASKMESSRERKRNEGSAFSNFLLSYMLRLPPIATVSRVISGFFLLKTDLIFSVRQASPARNGVAILPGYFFPKPAAIQLKISR